MESLVASNGEQNDLLTAVNDDHGGVIVELKGPIDPRLFGMSLKLSIWNWRKQGIKGVWIKLPIELASLVQLIVEEGFWYHHAEPNYLMLVYWIPATEHTIPANATHRVGVGAFVVNDRKEILVVQEKSGILRGLGFWKIPTGVINQGEDLFTGVIREVKEETGIDTEFVEVLAFRHSHKSFFEKSDLFFLCMLRPLSFVIQKQESEIEAAQWMAIEEYAADPLVQKHEFARYILNIGIAKMEKRYTGLSPVSIKSAFIDKQSYFYLNSRDLDQKPSSVNESRSSMEHGKLNFVERDDFIFAGAIFMSNRQTKRECLQRKLFGLPRAKYRFLKQVKSGMILFLFEHEERKLYGVFEATSDGALNIIPDAFRSTGQSYPAQILFKRIWMCKPLCEDEFRNAIAENYYSPNKFHFGLSYEQVIKLIHLFYSRKINIKQSKALGMPNKIIEKFESDASDDGCLTKTEAYFKCRSDEYSRGEKNEVRRKLAPHQTSMDSPMLYKRPASTMRMQHTAANTGRESNLSYSLNSYTETLSSQRCSVSLPHDHIAFHHFSIEKQPSTTKEIEYKPLPLHSSCYMSNLHNKVAPILMGSKHYSSPDTVAAELSCSRPNIMPRMTMIQEEDAFTSLHVMNDLSPQTEIVQHTRLSGAHPNQVFEFPDYIPLVEESQRKHRENYNSYLDDSEYSPTKGLNSYIPSTCKDISKHYYCSADGYPDDDDELKTYQRVQDDEYNVVGSSLHADSDLSRTSVFSRLSGHQKICNHESPEPSFGEQLGGLSLDRFLNILSTRRSGWSSMEVSKQLDWDSNEQHGSVGLFDHRSRHQNEITQLPVQPVERSEIDQCEAITDPEHVRFTSALDSDLNNDMIAEESFELPFYNFRRRNTSQKYEVQDDSDKYGDMCGNEAKLSKCKRRRIVRPSLYEEMHQNMNPEVEETISAQMKEQTEVQMSAQMILESKNESKANTVHRFPDSVVPVLQTVGKYEPVGDLLEQSHVTSVVESLDYIPID